MSSSAMLTVLPLSAMLVGGAFGIVILNHYFSTRRRPHELIWGIAFLLFAVAAACQIYADVSGGWTPLVARTYYLTGAILNVGLLGLGTIFLLFRGRPAAIALAIVALLAAYSIFVVYTAPAQAAALTHSSEVDWKSYFGIDITPRILAGVFSGVGSIVVILGAVWSGIVFWRKGIMKHRMYGVFLLAAGTLLIGLGGTVKGLFHNDNFLYPTMAVGVLIMFVGYLETIRTVQATQPAATQPAPTSTPSA